MTTALLYDPTYLKHETGHHPETPERLSVIISALQQDEELWNRIIHRAPRSVSDEDIMRCHSYRLSEQVRSLCDREARFVDLDTAICPQSFEVAKLAAGAREPLGAGIGQIGALAQGVRADPASLEKLMNVQTDHKYLLVEHQPAIYSLAIYTAVV